MKNLKIVKFFSESNSSCWSGPFLILRIHTDIIFKNRISVWSKKKLNLQMKTIAVIKLGRAKLCLRRFKFKKSYISKIVSQKKKEYNPSNPQKTLDLEKRR